MATVERTDAHRLHRARVKTTDIDAATPWVGARHVEGLDATYRTEQVFRRMSIECVTLKYVIARNEFESIHGDD
jgi:hypothetical protein